MRSVIVGGSAGLGRCIAEELARRGHQLYLVARGERDLEAIAADLTTRYGATVHWTARDVLDEDPESIRRLTVDAMGGIENLIICVGVVETENDCGATSFATIDRLIRTNLLAPIGLANAFLPLLERVAGTSIVGIGSIAAIRGRRQNMTYGCAKAGLDHYFQSLRHLLAQTGSPCRIQFYRAGYLATRMTFGQKLHLPAMAPERAARIIANNLGRDLGCRYLPWWWLLVAMVLKALPWSIFRHLRI